ncbi:MAG: SDR family oxidoreductase [Clostridia bacterium]|nr:SDR family oxidoreductase [Clostridia bacterium]
MIALITGASSGLGYEFAKLLSEKGYDIIAVARRTDRLISLANELSTKVTPITADLSDLNECIRIFEETKDKDIDIVINNAGFGLLGEFSKTDLSRELKMLDVNCRASHILTKLFLSKFLAENKGYILNICSVGGFMPGPLLAGYYATKAYLVSLTRAIQEEIGRSGKNVYIGCVCPGPIDTEFNSVAMGSTKIKSRSACEIAEFSINKMFKRKTTIIPGIEVKFSALAARLLPTSLMTKITYNIQKKKLK